VFAATPGHRENFAIEELASKLGLAFVDEILGRRQFLFQCGTPWEISGSPKLVFVLAEIVRHGSDSGLPDEWNSRGTTNPLLDSPRVCGNLNGLSLNVRQFGLGLSLEHAPWNP
jgi:hypothetical protein